MKKNLQNFKMIIKTLLTFSLLSVVGSEDKRLPAIVSSIFKISKDKPNYALKRVTVLISSKTCSVYIALKKRLKNQVTRICI